MFKGLTGTKDYAPLGFDELLFLTYYPEDDGPDAFPSRLPGSTCCGVIRADQLGADAQPKASPQGDTTPENSDFDPATDGSDVEYEIVEEDSPEALDHERLDETGRIVVHGPLTARMHLKLDGVKYEELTDDVRSVVDDFNALVCHSMPSFGKNCGWYGLLTTRTNSEFPTSNPADMQNLKNEYVDYISANFWLTNHRTASRWRMLNIIDAYARPNYRGLDNISFNLSVLHWYATTRNVSFFYSEGYQVMRIGNPKYEAKYLFLADSGHCFLAKLSADLAHRSKEWRTRAIRPFIGHLIYSVADKKFLTFNKGPTSLLHLPRMKSVFEDGHKIVTQLFDGACISTQKAKYHNGILIPSVKDEGMECAEACVVHIVSGRFYGSYRRVSPEAVFAQFDLKPEYLEGLRDIVGLYDDHELPQLDPTPAPSKETLNDNKDTLAAEFKELRNISFEGVEESNPVDIPDQTDKSDDDVGWISKIIDLAKQYVPGDQLMIFTTWASAATNLLTNIVTLARAVCRGGKADIILAVTSLVTGVFNSLVAVGVTIQTSTFQVAALNALKSYFLGFTKRAGSYYVSIIKVVTATVGIVSVILGFGGSMSRLGSAMSMARATGDISGDVATALSKFLGYDLNGDDDATQVLAGLEERMDRYIAMPNADLAGDHLKDARILIKECKTKSLTKMPLPVNAITAFMQKLAKLEESVAKIDSHIASSGRKPVPVAIYLYSRQGGLGKTSFAAHMARTLAAGLDGFNEYIYETKAHSQHAAPYANESTMIIDEMGAVDPTPTHNPWNGLNDLISESAVPSPTAGLEGKDQKLKPRLIVMCSNQPLYSCTTGMKEHAQEALYTRIRCIEVVDENFNPALGRMNQGHRKPDFTHLSFKMHGNNKRKSERAMETDELMKWVANQLKIHDESHCAMLDMAEKVNTSELKFKYAGKPIVLSKRNGSTTRHVISIIGLPQTGKSSAVLPQVIDTADAYGLPVKAPKNLAELPDAVTEPGLVVCDDLFDFSDKASQQLFMEAYNSSHPNVKFVMVTNYGPSSWTAWSPPFKTFRSGQPGFLRRTGFTENRYTQLWCKTEASLTDYRTGVQINPAEQALKSWMSFDAKSNEVRVLKDLPARIPFGPKEADLWIDIPESQSPAQAISLLRKAASARFMAHAYKKGLLSIRDPAGLDWADIIKNAAPAIPGAKIYVRRGQLVIYVNGLDAYWGAEVGRMTISERGGSKIICHDDGTPADINKKLVDAVVKKQPEGVPAKDYLALSLEWRRNSVVWALALRQFPPTMGEYWAARLAQMKDLGKRFLKKISENPTMFFFASVLIAGAGLYWLSCGETDKIETQFTNMVKQIGTRVPTLDCKVCFIAGEGDDSQAVLSDACPVMAMKGGRRGKQKSQHVRVNGESNKASEFEESPVGGPLAHDNKSHWKNNNGYLKDSDSFVKHYDGYSVQMGYRYNTAGQLEHTYDFIDSASPRAAGKSKFANNVVKLTTDDGLTCYGLMYNSFIVRYPAHLDEDDHCKLTLMKDGVTYRVKEMDRDITKDRVFATVTDADGKPVDVQGIKDITQSLLPHAAMAQIKSGDWHSPDGYSSYNQKLQMQTEKKFFLEGELVTRGPLMSASYAYGRPPAWTAEGNCGSVVSTLVKGKEYLIGQYSYYTDSAQTAFFPVATREDWNGLAVAARATKTKTCSGINSTPINQLLPKATATHTEVPTEFFELLRRKDPAYYNPGGKMEQIATIHENSIPMDQVCKKSLIEDGAFTALFGNLKQPVPPKEWIEKNYRDKIPADASGNYHAQNVRLTKAANARITCGEGEIQELHDIAISMAQYWKLRVATNYTPLDLDEAISGSARVAPLDLKTSTGATYQMLFPRAPTKEKAFEGETGSWTYDFIKAQWNGWKERKNFILPSSYSLKAECLPNEKVWKKRIVNVLDPMTVVNQRRLLLPIQHLFDSLGPDSPFALRLNPITDFHGMALKLLSFKHIYEMDVSAFDLTAPRELIEAAFTFFKELVTAGPILANMFDTMCDGVNSTPAFCDGAVLARDGGVPSGMACTSLVDSVCMMLIAAYGWAAHSQLSEFDANEYYAETWSYSCGDDTIIASKDAEGLGDAIISRAAMLGMTLTNPTKDGGLGESTTLAGASFTSRTFFQSTSGVWFGRLKKESLAGMLIWASTGADASEIHNTLRQALFEIALYDEDTYNRFIRIALDNGHQLTEKSWATMRKDLAAQVRAAHGEHFIKFVESINSPTFKELVDIPVIAIDREKFFPAKPKKSMESSKATVVAFKAALANFESDAEVLLLNPYIGPVMQHTEKVVYEGRELLYPQLKSGYMWKTICAALNGAAPEWTTWMPRKPTGPVGKKLDRATLWWDITNVLKDEGCDKKMAVIYGLSERCYDTTKRSGVEPTTTAEMPNNAAVPSASSTNADEGVASATDDTLPVVVVADPMPPTMFSGVGKSAPVLERTGGIAELNYQLGIDNNINTVLTKKIINEVVNIQVGVGYDTVLYEVPINFWSPRMLNKWILKYADCHKMFDGTVLLHFDTFSATTIIGGIKVYLLPKVAEDTPLNQIDLDIYTPAEVALSNSGSFTVPVRATTGANAKTGVFRDDMDSYGKIIILASVHVQNAFGSTVDIKMRVSSSLTPESGYRIVTDPESSVINSSFDIIPTELGSFLATDGIRTDGIDYNQTNNFSRLGDQELNGIIAPTINRYYRGDTREENGVEGILGFGSEFVEQVYLRDGSDQVSQVRGDPHPDYVDSHDIIASDLTSDIWTDYENNPEAIVITGVDLSKVYSDSTSGYTLSMKPLSSNRTRIIPGQVCTNYGRRFATNNRWMVAKTENHETQDAAERTWTFGGAADTRVELSGVPICNATPASAESVPTGFLSVKLTGGVLVPAVLEGVLGQTIPAGPDHVTAVKDVELFLRDVDYEAVVTTFRSSDTGRPVFTIVRNVEGMFTTDREPMHGLLDYTLEELTQTHTLSTLKWPEVDSWGYVESRNPTAYTVSGLINNRKVTAPIDQELRDMILSLSGNVAKQPRKQKTLEQLRTVKPNPVGRQPVPTKACALATGMAAMTTNLLSGQSLLKKATPGGTARLSMLNSGGRAVNTATGGAFQHLNIKEQGKQTRQTLSHGHELKMEQNEQRFGHATALMTQQQNFRSQYMTQKAGASTNSVQYRK